MNMQFVNVENFGAVGDGTTDDTTAIQNALDHCRDNDKVLHAMQGPYLITSINVDCHVYGARNNRFASGYTTFTSNVGPGIYAITLVGYRARLENVTLRNTGAGNGINCQLVGTSTVLKDVSTSTTFTRVTGSGSIGVNFGSDAVPGEQAITGTYDVVNSRDYDICFRMRFYSNSNTYKQLYALATNNTEQPATVGFLVDGRGATFICCNAESNFLKFLDETSAAEENTYINFWMEGEAGAECDLFGAGSMMINPYGFVGGSGGSISVPINKSAYATIVKNKPGTVAASEFTAQGVNLVENAEFATDLGGLNWGANAIPSGSTIFAHNSIQLRDTDSVTSFSVDHLMSYVDLDQHEWIRGQTVTMACFGQAASGVSMSIRGIIRGADGSSTQYATSESFSDSAPEVQKISFNVPNTIGAERSRYLVFRMNCSNVMAASPSIGGEIAMPLVFIGNKLQDMTPKPLGDGANNIYGNHTFIGGGWNEAHIVLGTHHLWVDSTGTLRIKAGAPTSDTDGATV